MAVWLERKVRLGWVICGEGRRGAVESQPGGLAHASEKQTKETKARGEQERMNGHRLAVLDLLDRPEDWQQKSNRNYTKKTTHPRICANNVGRKIPTGFQPLSYGFRQAVLGHEQVDGRPAAEDDDHDARKEAEDGAPRLPVRAVMLVLVEVAAARQRVVLLQLRQPGAGVQLSRSLRLLGSVVRSAAYPDLNRRKAMHWLA